MEKSNSNKFDISVIIPCYNAESNLERCINSVINQTLGFENIELILIDDASTDGTKNIIKNFSKMYKNIIPIICDVNSGPGVGRNKGIKEASSDFIMFLDTDDEFDLDICKRLFEEIKLDGDIISCDFIVKYEDYDYKTIVDSNIGKTIGNRTIFNTEDLIYYNDLVVWNKIFRRNIIIESNVLFPPIYNGEDEIFLRNLYQNVEKLIHINGYFGYFKHDEESSISNSSSLNDLYSFLALCDDIIKIYDKQMVDLSRVLKERIFIILSSFFLHDIIKRSKNSDIYLFFDRLQNFERKIAFDKSVGILCDIPNFFIKNRKFKLALIYFKFLLAIRKLNFILKIYRLFHNKE